MRSLLKTYPVLTDAHWVLEEMKIICQAQDCCDDTHLDLTSKILEKSWSSAQCLAKMEKIPIEIKKIMSREKLGWMVGIPTIFSEKYDCFLTVDKDPKYVYPTIAFNSLLKRWTIHFDGETVEGVTSFHHALACLIAMYWVFNVKFPTTAASSLNFIASFLAQIPNVKYTAAVRTKLNLIFD